MVIHRTRAQAGRQWSFVKVPPLGGSVLNHKLEHKLHRGFALVLEPTGIVGGLKSGYSNRKDLRSCH
jgi:hypothetical protein